MSSSKIELAEQIQDLNEKINLLRRKGSKSKEDVKEKARLSKLMTELILQLDSFADDKNHQSSDE